MGITVTWYNEEKTVIRLAFEETWEWDDFILMEQQTAALREQVDHPIGYLVQATGVKELPPGLSVRRMREVLWLNPDEESFVIIAGTSLFIQMALRSILQLVGSDQANRFSFVSSLEEADRLLAKRLDANRDQHTPNAES